MVEKKGRVVGVEGKRDRQLLVECDFALEGAGVEKQSGRVCREDCG